MPILSIIRLPKLARNTLAKKGNIIGTACTCYTLQCCFNYRYVDVNVWLNFGYPLQELHKFDMFQNATALHIVLLIVTKTITTLAWIRSGQNIFHILKELSLLLSSNFGVYLPQWQVFSHSQVFHLLAAKKKSSSQAPHQESLGLNYILLENYLYQVGFA